MTSSQKPPPKRRLDELLITRSLAKSRNQGQELIKSGTVLVDGVTITKPGRAFLEDAEISLSEPPHPYVSRGGIKLAHALEQTGLDVTGMIAADIGASTGGFTDVLLQNGATRVYAVDVGHGQLADSLRVNPRVINLERTHAKDLTDADIPDPLALIVCDVSFISLKKALPAVLKLTAKATHLVALIKPQFEAGRAYLQKGGIVRDESVHRAVCEDIKTWLTGFGWTVKQLLDSPITGGDGNKEFLVWATKEG